MNYRTCSNCGANLDPEETCECTKKEAAPMPREKPRPKITTFSLATPARTVKHVRRCVVNG